MSAALDSRLARVLRAARRVGVLTGAGVSAESGIPTFRDAQTGLWARYRPEELATAEAFCRDCGYRRLVLSTSELQVAAARLYESSGYRLVREEQAAQASHKSVGAGLTRYHYEKALM